MIGVMHLEPLQAQEGLCPRQDVLGGGGGKKRSGEEASFCSGPERLAP